MDIRIPIVALAVGCSGSVDIERPGQDLLDPEPAPVVAATGGATSTSAPRTSISVGGSVVSTGGAQQTKATGGAVATGGSRATGGAAIGGQAPTGGSQAGGAVASVGTVQTGGSTPTGGSSQVATGGASTVVAADCGAANYPGRACEDYNDPTDPSKCLTRHAASTPSACVELADRACRSAATARDVACLDRCQKCLLSSQDAAHKAACDAATKVLLPNLTC